MQEDRLAAVAGGAPLELAIWFYNHRASPENLIKEANNDAGLTTHGSNRWMTNDNWLHIAMLT